MQFSRELLLKCYPHKESVLFQLNVAIELSYNRDTLVDSERIEFLAATNSLLYLSQVSEAAAQARRAGYNLLAEAIILHFSPADALTPPIVSV